MYQQQGQIQTQLLKTRQSLTAQLGESDDRLLGQNLVELSYAFQIQNRLERIDRALARLENGQYGLCQSCRQPINPERLEVVPEADLCLGCQSKLENKRRKSYMSTFVYSTNGG